MNQKERPIDCTSLNCESWGGDYCPKCSHARFYGEGLSKGGRIYRWEFNPYFGPLFLKVNGEPLKNQPESEHHPAWYPFNKWLKERPIGGDA